MENDYKFSHQRYRHVYFALIPWLSLCCATFSIPPFELGGGASHGATRSHFHLSSFMLTNQLAGQPFHRILEPATTCSVFARPSFAQHLLCHSPHPTIQPSPLSVYYLLYPAQAAGPQLRPILEFCLRGRALRRGRVKRGRVHCIASTQPATPRIAKREGGAASVQCKMQSSIAESS